MFAVPLLAIGGLQHDPAAVATGIMVTAIFAPLILVLAWWYPRLVITPDTIERHNVGYTLRTPWGNVARIRLARGSEGLILRGPMEERGAYRFAKAATFRFGIETASLYDRDVLELIRQRRFIPLEAFYYWFKHGMLRYEIERYAPWLADDLRARSR